MQNLLSGRGPPRGLRLLCYVKICLAAEGGRKFSAFSAGSGDSINPPIVNPGSSNPVVNPSIRPRSSIRRLRGRQSINPSIRQSHQSPSARGTRPRNVRGATLVPPRTCSPFCWCCPKAKCNTSSWTPADSALDFIRETRNTLARFGSLPTLADETRSRLQ